jgi:hypothetical protein
LANQAIMLGNLNLLAAVMKTHETDSVQKDYCRFKLLAVLKHTDAMKINHCDRPVFRWGEVHLGRPRQALNWMWSLQYEQRFKIEEIRQTSMIE